MSPLIGIGFLAFFVVSLVVGVRLLLLYRRTGESPELLIGLGVLGIGPVGFGAMIIAQVLQASSPTTASLLFGVAGVTIAVGVFCKFLFNWRVYHRDSRIVAGLTAAMGAAIAGVFCIRLFTTGFEPISPLDSLGMFQSGAQIACLLWGSFEALRYWGMMRRRARLGLADPVVSNRFLMWGIGAGSAGLGTAVGTVWSIATGTATFATPWVVASSSAHGLVAAIAISLAFMPPGAYLRWIQSRTSPVQA